MYLIGSEEEGAFALKPDISFLYSSFSNSACQCNTSNASYQFWVSKLVQFQKRNFSIAHLET